MRELERAIAVERPAAEHESTHEDLYDDHVDERAHHRHKTDDDRAYKQHDENKDPHARLLFEKREAFNDPFPTTSGIDSSRIHERSGGIRRGCLQARHRCLIGILTHGGVPLVQKCERFNR